MIELRVSEPDPIILEAEEQDQASLAVLEAFVSGGDIPAYTGSYNVTPTQSQQTLETNGKKMVRDVKVAPIPSQYIIPAGTLEITENGQQSVREYENVNVNVPAPTGEKTINVSQNGTVTEDVANYATAKVVTNVPASAVDTGTKNINSNGTHNVVGYASAEVNVPNSYAASDEGKVVSNGALVSQSSQTVTENGTYDTTLKDEVVVNVSGGGGGGSSVIASGTWAGNNAYNITVPLGKKMAQTDFVFVMYLPNNTEITYVDSGNDVLIANAFVCIPKQISKIDLSQDGTAIQFTGGCIYNVNNEGVITQVSKGGTVAAGVHIRATSAWWGVFGNRTDPDPTMVTMNRDSSGFAMKLNRNAWQSRFMSGYTYDWEVIYFGTDPTNDIVEVP